MKRFTPIFLVLIFLVSLFGSGGVNAAPADLGALRGVSPSVSPDGTRLIFPDCPIEGYKIGVYGSSNVNIIDTDGNVYTPLVDGEVKLIYKAVPENGAGGEIVANFNVKLTVRGSETFEEGDNKKPDVLPSVREWKGGKGVFALKEGAGIAVNDETALFAANRICDCVSDMLGYSVTAFVGEPKDGGIALELDSSARGLGDEGYYLDIGDIVTVRAASVTGLWYGGISLVQIAYQSESKTEIPRGTARDYPAYEVRSAHLDVGRAWITMDYLKEITYYCAWYKINDLHLHINDWGGLKYEAFRLESDFKGLAADDGFYTKDEYREYQKEALSLGINIVTEIDTPAHATSLERIYPQVPSLGWSYVDVRDPQSAEIVKKLLSEYIEGDDPVFASGYVDIGTDEFPLEFAPYVRSYVASLLDYIRGVGFTPRLWAKFGSSKSYDGDADVTGYAQASYAVPEMQNVNVLVDYGYDIINAVQNLYIVPGSPHGYADYMDVKSLYSIWEVYRNDYYGPLLTEGHPKLKGAMFSLWNDLYTTNCGFSVFDIFDRFRGGVMLISEKTWYGSNDGTQTADMFMAKVNVLGEKAPLCNPMRGIDSANGTVCFYDFENNAEDISGNGCGLTLSGCAVEEGSLVFDGKGSVELEYGSVGFPYTVSFDLFISEPPSPDTPLFDGSESYGTFYLNADDTGKMGFRRGVYTFLYDYKPPVGEWIHLTLTCDNKQTVLVLNNVYKFFPENQKYAESYFSSTFVLPTEKIGYGLVGKIDNLTISVIAEDVSVYVKDYNIDQTDKDR